MAGALDKSSHSLLDSSCHPHRALCLKGWTHKALHFWNHVVQAVITLPWCIEARMQTRPVILFSSVGACRACDRCHCNVLQDSDLLLSLQCLQDLLAMELRATHRELPHPDRVIVHRKGVPGSEEEEHLARELRCFPNTAQASPASLSSWTL